MKFILAKIYLNNNIFVQTQCPICDSVNFVAFCYLEFFTTFFFSPQCWTTIQLDTSSIWIMVMVTMMMAVGNGVSSSYFFTTSHSSATAAFIFSSKPGQERCFGNGFTRSNVYPMMLGNEYGKGLLLLVARYLSLYLQFKCLSFLSRNKSAESFLAWVSLNRH